MIRIFLIYIFVLLALPKRALCQQVSVFKTLTVKDGLPSNFVFDASEDENGFLWIGTDKGLAKYDGFTWQIIDKEMGLPGNYINTLSCDGRGGIQLGISAKGDYYYNINTKSITPIISKVAIKEKDKLEEYPSKEKKLLWQFNNDSVFLRNGEIYLYRKDKIFSKRIFSKRGYFGYTSMNNTFFCWNINDGFWEFDIEGNFKQYTIADGLASNLVNKIFVTIKKDVFVCTMGGGLQKLLQKQNAKINTNEKQVRAIAVEKNIAYVCTENKLLLIDLLQKSVTQSFPLNESTVECIEVKDGNIAIGSLTGIHVYNIKNKQLVKTNSIKVGAGVSTVFAVDKNHLASTYGSGLMLFDKNNNATFLNKLSQYSILEKLQQLKNGYVGLTYEDGFHFFNSKMEAIKTLTTKDGLLSNEIHDVHEYRDSFWIGTAKGITIYANNKVVKNILLTNEGKGNKCIYSFHDNVGKYWVVTNKALHEYDNEKLFAVGTYSIINSEKENVKTALFDMATNTLLAGTSNEISLLNMGSIIRDTNVVAPALLFASADNVTKDFKENFSLPYNFKKISFSFIPGVSNPFSQPNILYKLEGFNETFQTLKDSTVVNFEKLRPGNYTLLAKTRNIDGYESNEIILANFVIKKPYWLQAWFIILAAIATVLGSFFLFNYFQHKKQLQKDKANALALSVSKERERISKDLHDHLGTSLVTMIAQTDNIENKLINNNVEDALLKVQQLSDQSRESMNVLRETIWAVQENSHTLSEFTLRVRTFLQRVMDVHEMSWVLECNGSLQKDLSAEQTLHLFRMIQEVTQNILKHAAATHAQYTIDANTNIFKITITDNGKGFDTSAIYTSNGLKNLATRIKELDGTINISSEIQKGTTIIVQLSI